MDAHAPRPDDPDVSMRGIAVIELGRRLVPDVHRRELLDHVEGGVVALRAVSRVGIIIAIGAGIRIGAAFFDLIPEAVGPGRRASTRSWSRPRSASSRST